jgi:hypothetical protein
MIDLDKGSEQLDKADGFLTKLSKLLKKHWIILLLLALGAGVYYVVTDDTPIDEPTDEYYEEDAGYYEEDTFNIN